MRTLFDRTVFVAGGTVYDWGDVVLAAVRWGRWIDLEGTLRQGLACVAHAEQTGQEPTPAGLTRATNEFRYARNLVSAAEAEAWLREWGLTVEAWLGYVSRALLRGRWGTELPDIAARYPIDPETLAPFMKAEAVCSGQLAAFARDLAARAAVSVGARAGLAAAPPGAGVAAPDVGVLEEARRACPGLAPHAYRSKLARLIDLDRAFAELGRPAVPPRALRSELSANHLDWIRFDGRGLTFHAEPRAREAAACIRDDGRTMAEVGAAARTPLHHASFYLGSLGPEARPHFLGARIGEVIGPLAWRDGFLVFEVADKRLPSLDDPEVRERAAERVRHRVIEEQVEAHVSWRVRL
jgi:hypothetical protein